MANANIATGLTPRRYRNGAPWTGAARTYHVPATNTTSLFIGDPVLMTGTGDSMGYPDVGIAPAGGRVTGVVVGFRPTAPFSPNKFLPAGTEGYVIVTDDPTLLYEVQDNGALAVTAIGQNADLVAGAGNVGTGWSGWQLNAATAATTATLQVRIIELQHRADVEPGAQQKWLVALNNSTETPAAGSTGI